MDEIIITISRKNGSGGRDLGRILSERLGIPVHDVDVVERAAKAMGLSTKDAFDREERRTSESCWGYDTANPIYDAEADAIRKLAEQGPCIFVGRGADIVLERRKPFRIFVTADEGDCIRRSMERNGISEKDAADRVRKRNRERGIYYQRHAGRIWGLAENYDLCLNTSVIDLDRCADIVIGLLVPKG